MRGIESFAADDTTIYHREEKLQHARQEERWEKNTRAEGDMRCHAEKARLICQRQQDRRLTCQHTPPAMPCWAPCQRAKRYMLLTYYLERIHTLHTCRLAFAAAEPLLPAMRHMLLLPENTIIDAYMSRRRVAWIWWDILSTRHAHAMRWHLVTNMSLKVEE